MSMALPSGDDLVTLVCTKSCEIETEMEHKEILVSTDDIHCWDLPTILSFQTVKVEARRNRLIDQSPYFRSLLGGSFSESCLNSISIKWNTAGFLYILKHIYGCLLDVTSDNFLPLLEGALYFGVETLLSKCHAWFLEVSASSGFGSLQIELDDLIQIWEFGLEHGSTCILEICASYLAKNFMFMSRNFIESVPFEMLLSCIKHPLLTVDSEMHLSDAIIFWMESNIENLESPSKAQDKFNDILNQIRFSLLPLWFAAGKKSSFLFSKLAEESIDSVDRLVNTTLPMGPMYLFEHEDFLQLRIRLTEYTKKVNLSGCPQITSAVLLLSLLPSADTAEPTARNNIKQLLVDSSPLLRDKYEVPLQTLSFRAVQMVDISKCRRLHIKDAIKCFSKSFPSLKVLKAAYLLNTKTTDFLQVARTCLQVCEIDLTVDINPLLPALVSVPSSKSSVVPLVLEKSSASKRKSVDDLSSYELGLSLSNITKLILEGRTDISDMDLQYISENCMSLCHLNLKGCTSVTDVGMSGLICRCMKLHSIVVCDTYFGIQSTLALSSANNYFADTLSGECQLNSLASSLQTLHIGGCTAIKESSLVELLSQMRYVTSLYLRDTCLVDDALCSFSGISLEMLDVSNTMISGAALTRIVSQNPGLKCLKARGCRNLSPTDLDNEGKDYICGSLYGELGKMCRLEEISFGWGFSRFSLKSMETAIKSLKTITVGLGGTLDEDVLLQLPSFCPMLESINLHFQVLSDTIMINMCTSLRNLRVLALCYCFGDFSIASFKFSMKNLKRLRLERVIHWMTDNDLIILTENCPNLVELSLLGSPLLSSDSQQIISRGWPGLISLHIEECGDVTMKGVASLLDCRALEDLLLRHNGPGLPRNFIMHAASKLPMLRKLSLDVCDANEGGFDIPDRDDRYYLSHLKVARCKSRPSAFNLPQQGSLKKAVHKDTLVLVWNSRNLVRTVVKERF